MSFEFQGAHWVSLSARHAVYRDESTREWLVYDFGAWLMGPVSLHRSAEAAIRQALRRESRAKRGLRL